MKSIALFDKFIIKMIAEFALPKWLIASLVGASNYFLGGPSGVNLLVGAGGLIVLDTVTGFWAAKQNGDPISSAKLSRVLTKLLGYGAVIIVASVVVHAVPHAVGWSDITAASVLTLVITTEAISILENVRKMGIQLPAPIQKLLAGNESKP